MMPVDPRGDLTQVDEEVCKDHLWNLIKILSADKEDHEIAYELKAYVKEFLNPWPETFIRVGDLLVEKQILTRAQLKAWLSMETEWDLSNGHFHDF